MEPKAGKRIVSKEEYAELVSKKLTWTLSSVGLYILSMFLIILACLIVSPKFMLPHEMTRTGWIVNILTSIGMFLIAYGFTRLARKGLNKSKLLGNAVPVTRANTADLPAPDSLVRASSEPLQAQEGVLLRAAAEGMETPPEQLVRASVGME